MFFSGQVTNTWKSDTAPNTVFFVVFLMSAPITSAVQIHVTSHCYIANRLAWLASLLSRLFLIGIYDSDQTGLSCVNVHMQKLSRFYMPLKIFVKNSSIMVCCINVFLGTLL